MGNEGLNVFTNALNWVITVGNGTGEQQIASNTEICRYMTTPDKFGKECIAGVYG